MIDNTQVLEHGWAEAARIFRRVCTLRANGNTEEADGLESAAFARAVDSLRDSAGGAAEWETRVARLRHTEEERIAHASVLADLVAPMIAQRLVLQAGAAVAPAKPSLSPRPAVPRDAPRDIADFIDEMLAQTAGK